MNHRLHLIWLHLLLLLIWCAFTATPSRAQPNQQQSSPSPTTTAKSTPKNKFKNAFGVWLGPKVIYTTEGIYFARQISPHLNLEVGTGLPLSPYNFSSSHIFLDQSSNDLPFALSSHQQARVISGRAQISPWRKQSPPHQPTINSEHLFFYITVDISHQTITYRQSRDQNILDKGQFSALGGGTTGGMGYYFQPKPKVFFSLSYMLYAYHRLLLVTTHHKPTDELRSVLSYKYSATKLFIYRNPLHNLLMLSLSAGYLF